MSAATTRAEHVRHRTNQTLHEYDGDLSLIAAAYREEYLTRRSSVADGIALMFRLACEHTAVELLRLENFLREKAEA